ncbi:LuxR family transcriptional regulatory protein [Yersinia massiliensis]|uniref:helix-turn-helix transcriptional regulator n=1 Tax=Yersinia massiliensis TaxID=419257 RepID=UPI0005DD89A8|nr:LuxR C-terminal-related transcriptional regulator [Yersinia massiliensis]CNH31471.1 LuxR family transcriptional regulatory protein [Yersinia massiliensis]
MIDVIIFSKSSLFIFSLQIIIHNNMSVDKEKINTKLFNSFEKFNNQLDSNKINIVIFDIDGISKEKQNVIFDKVKHQDRNVHLLVFCQYEEDSLYYHTLSEVTRSVVSKTAPITEIASLFNKLLIWVSKNKDDNIPLDLSAQSQPMLSKREKEVLHLATMGMDYKSISEHLNISRKTVSHYMSNIRDKYGYKRNANVYFRY